MAGLRDFFNSLLGKDPKPVPGEEQPLYVAVKAGNVSKVQSLLRDGADPNIAGEHHLTPLHQAAFWGETEIVALLLEHGAKATADNGHGWTPLHSAAASGGRAGRAEIIDMLLAAGADPRQPDKNGWTPEDYMTLWSENAAAAAKLREQLRHAENDNAPAKAPPGKPPKINTPRH